MSSKVLYPRIRYQPGVRYVVPAVGVTEQELGANYHLAVPVEQGAIDHPGVAQMVITAVNVTNQNIVFVLYKISSAGKSRADGSSKGRVFNAFELVPGASSHFVTPPLGHRVSWTYPENSSQGVVKVPSEVGLEFEFIEGKKFSFSPNETAGVNLKQATLTEPSKYAIFTNNSKEPINVCITRPRSIYPPAGHILESHIKKRNPDAGHEVVERAFMDPRTTWELRTPDSCYIIAIDETIRKQKGNEYDHFVNINEVWNKNDHVEYEEAPIQVGQVAVACMSNDRNTSQLQVFDWAQIKPVSPSIVDSVAAGTETLAAGQGAGY